MIDDRRPLYEQPEIYDRRWTLLWLNVICLVLVVMSVSGLNVALPSMQRDLGATSTELQWIIDAYAIVFAGLLLIAGAIGDRYGRKLALLGGLFVFGAGSLVGAIADTPELVIASRALSGVGAAFIMPATLSLLTAVFPPHERGKAIATWAGFAGAGGALGPLVVGFLLTGAGPFPSFWWGSAFVVNFVLSFAVLAIIAVYAPRSRDAESTPLDPVGAVLSLIGLSALLFGIIEGAERGWTDSWVLVAFALAVVVLGSFVGWELRTRHPMLPMNFFKDRGFSTGSVVITFGFLVMFGFFFLITLYFQFVRGWSPLRAAVATLPFAAAMIVVAPRSDGLVHRFGYHRVIIGGFASMTAGFAILSQLTPSTPYLVLVVALVLLAGGMGASTAPSTGAIIAAVPLNKAGVGSAVNDTTRELGGSLGIAILGSISASLYRGGIGDDVTGGLPDEAAELVGESVGEAMFVASEVGGTQGAAIADAAGVAFADAVGNTFLVSAAVAALIGIGVFWSGRGSDIRIASESGSEVPVG